MARHLELSLGVFQMMKQIEKQSRAAQFSVPIEAEYHNLLVGRRHFADIDVHLWHTFDPIPFSRPSRPDYSNRSRAAMGPAVPVAEPDSGNDCASNYAIQMDGSRMFGGQLRLIKQ